MSHRNAIHEEEYKGLNIYIVPDDDPQNPIEDFDMLGKQVYWHNRMNLGHCYKETNKYDPQEWLERELAGEYELYEDWETNHSNRVGYFPYLMERFAENNLVIPVSAYEHGGITISASGRRAGWGSFDSGQLGFVYASHADILKEYGTLDLKNAEKLLIGEVETYDEYLTGQVYGYIIEEENGEQLVSCWGFLGDYKYCMEEAQSAADYWAEQKEKELKLYDERMVG